MALFTKKQKKKVVGFVATVVVLAFLTLFTDVGDVVLDELGIEGSSNNVEGVDGTEKEIIDVGDGELQVHFIDVGQGDATLLESVSDDGKEYTMLIDTGDWTGDEVVPYLQEEGIEDIDVLVGTHPHADHIGQMGDVVNEFNVDEVWMSGDTSESNIFVETMESIDEQVDVYEEPRAGDEYQVGDMDITIIHPENIGNGLNEGSISMKIAFGEVDFIFTGDAEEKEEQLMLERGFNLDADILHLGHHGSNTSTTEEFYNEVNPDVAIYSAGVDNKYNHPSIETVDLIESDGIDFYGTDVNGTVVLTTDGEECDIEVEQEGTPVGQTGK